MTAQDRTRDLLFPEVDILPTELPGPVIWQTVQNRNNPDTDQLLEDVSKHLTCKLQHETSTAVLLWATSWENQFMSYANNKGADQPVHTRSLIWGSLLR